jgi:hypothetical protein
MGHQPNLKLIWTINAELPIEDYEFHGNIKIVAADIKVTYVTHVLLRVRKLFFLYKKKENISEC